MTEDLPIHLVSQKVGLGASLHDLTIRLGEFQIVTNMAVMAAHSSFFEAKIQAEGDGPFEVDLDERKITAAGLKVAVEFCYTAEAKTTLADLTKVFGAAKYLQMADLRNSVELQMVKLASIDQTALVALNLIATNPVSHATRRLVIRGVAERFGQLPSDRLNETTTKEFCALLANPKLDEKLSYATAQRIVEWLEAKPNRIDMASRVLQLLRIPEMSDAEAKPTLKLLAEHKLDWVLAVDNLTVEERQTAGFGTLLDCLADDVGGHEWPLPSDTANADQDYVEREADVERDPPHFRESSSKPPQFGGFNEWEEIFRVVNQPVAFNPPQLAAIFDLLETSHVEAYMKWKKDCKYLSYYGLLNEDDLKSLAQKNYPSETQAEKKWLWRNIFNLANNEIYNDDDTLLDNIFDLLTDTQVSYYIESLKAYST